MAKKLTDTVHENDGHHENKQNKQNKKNDFNIMQIKESSLKQHSTANQRH